MLNLDEKYIARLQSIAENIQESDLYTNFMDTEEEAEYKVMCDVFEPRIAKVYSEVAANDPLQLVAFEKILMNPYFEGLFLPRILGYSALRGQINNQIRYVRPQNHFKEILLAILESSNFEFIKKRIGATLQLAFGLSSDIWITDLINSVANKRLRYYLQNNKLDRFRELNDRATTLSRYRNLFVKDNFLTADFPENFSELKVEYPELKAFLMYRIGRQLNNQSLLPYVVAAAKNPAFFGTNEHIQLLCLTMNFFQLDEADTAEVTTIFNKLRQEVPEFTKKFLSFIVEMHNQNFVLDSKAELKASAMVDRSIKDDITEFYRIADVVHTQGYTNEDVMQVVRHFYDNHEGLSTVNECLRRTIYGYLHRYITPLRERDYHDYFEISKVFAQYMRIFENEQFNQNLRDISLDYAAKCLVKFTDKRARDYQDVKRFVSSYFVAWHFLKEKDVVEMFKTRRKRKSSSES